MEQVGLEVTKGKLNDKVAIVTGGSRGIGAAIARLLTCHGTHVIIADILDEQGQELASRIGGQFIHCDISCERDVAQTVDAAVAQHGHLDIMVNNAGVPGHAEGIMDIDMNNLEAMMAVNLVGTIHGIKHAARAMTRQHGMGGSIICVASTAALMGGLTSHGYTMTKAAITGLVRSVAGELGEHGIRVNCVSPHGVPTSMLLETYSKLLGREGVRDEVERILTSKSRVKGRCGSEEDTAEAVIFLASEMSARFVAGHNLVVDGGFTSTYSGFIHSSS